MFSRFDTIPACDRRKNNNNTETYWKVWYGRINNWMYDMVVLQHDSVWRCGQSQMRGTLVWREAGRRRRGCWNADIRCVVLMSASITNCQLFMQLYTPMHGTAVMYLLTFLASRDQSITLQPFPCTPGWTGALTERLTVLEQPLDFYELDVLPVTQPVMSKH